MSDIMKSDTKIGFIGMGSMGFPICYGLQASGYQMIIPYYRKDEDCRSGYSELILDRDKKAAAMDVMVEKGAVAASDQKELIALADVIVISMPTSRQVEGLVLSSDGILNNAKPGTVVIDLTTADPSSTRSLAKQLEGKGIELLDAPISGGTRGAAAQTLSVMVGGNEQVYTEMLPVLNTIGNPEKVFYMGPSGAGNTIKVVNNCLSATHIAADTEALLIAAKAGIDPVKALAVINVSGGRSIVTEERLPNIVLPGKKFNFAMAMMRKDIALFSQITRDQKISAPVTNMANQIWHIPTQAGDDSNEDIANLIKMYQNWIGAEIYGVIKED